MMNERLSVLFITLVRKLTYSVVCGNPAAPGGQRLRKVETLGPSSILVFLFLCRVWTTSATIVCAQYCTAGAIERVAACFHFFSNLQSQHSALMVPFSRRRNDVVGVIDYVDWSLQPQLEFNRKHLIWVSVKLKEKVWLSGKITVGQTKAVS